MTFEISSLLLILFGSGLVLSTIAVIFTTSFLKTVILISSGSLMICLCYLCMDAPDVAMTEAAIGACLSTVILFSFAKKINNDDLGRSCNKLPAAIFSLILAGIIIYAGMDLDFYGSDQTAVHTYINQYFIKNTATDIGIDSFVAAILASYRGYDTLGETTVILTAPLAAAMILGKKEDAE